MLGARAAVSIAVDWLRGIVADFTAYLGQALSWFYSTHSILYACIGHHVLNCPDIPR